MKWFFSLMMLFVSVGLHLNARAETTADDSILGQGAFRYTPVRHWAADAMLWLPVGNGHGLAFDSSERLFMLNDNPKNNVLILDTSGKLLDHWTANMPGAHGLTLARENDGKEVLFITDTALHEVRKFALDGKELLRVGWPESTKLYSKADEYKPSKVIWLGGEFIVLDGYGKDYVIHYKADGTILRFWGGNLGEGENQLKHWGPHGGALDDRDKAHPFLMIGMSDQQYIKRFSLEGKYLDTIHMPGGNPRDGLLFGEFLFVPHLGDKWPQDKNSRGFISVLDKNYRIVSNIGGPPAEYKDSVLQPMKNDNPLFLHPHAVAVDKTGNLYVAQFMSPKTPLLKLERLK